MDRQLCFFYDIKNVYFPAYEISEPEGINLPENFPNCCNGHKQVVRETENFLDLFPDCCEAHRNFAKKFKRTARDFHYLKKKIVLQLEYTGQFIENHIEKNDWYKQITQYIELNVQSFGIPAVGLELYINFLKQDIEKNLNINDGGKKQKLLQYFETNNQITIEEFAKNLNLLQSAYAKWLKFFPFDLPYFQGLKKNFLTLTPFLESKPEYNPFLKMADAKLVDQKELVRRLVGVTKKLLGLVSSQEWFEKNKLDDNKRLDIKLAAEAHRVAQSSLVDDFTKNEKKYVKTIKKWLQNEKSFFTEMKSILEKKRNRPSKPIAFNYIGDPECLGDALHALHKLGAISEEIKLPRFKKLFNGKPVSKPIDWKGYKGDLKTFIKTINKCPNLECPYQQQWNIAVQCFTLDKKKLNALNLKTCKETNRGIYFKRAAKNLR